MHKLYICDCKDTPKTTMEEISVKRKPLALQLALVFLWIGAIVSLIAAGDGKGADNVAEHFTPMELRLMAIFQDIFIFIGPAVLFVFFLRHEKFSFLSLKKNIHPLWLICAIFAIFFSLPFIGWIGEVNAGLKFPPSMHGLEEWIRSKEEGGGKMAEIMLSDKTTMGIIMNLFVIAFLAALSEEFFFRGIIQKLFLETKMNYHVAIWLTAIIFSAFHMQFYGFLPRMFLGAMIGYLFYFTGNLWISIIGHFINNSIYIVIALASENVKISPLEQGKEEPGAHMSWPLIMLSVLLVVGVFIFLKRMKEKETSMETLDNQN